MAYEPVFQIRNKNKSEISSAIMEAEKKIPGLVFNYPPIAVWDYDGLTTSSAEDIWTGSQRYSHNMYIHVPFCRQKCSFCYYNVVPGASDDYIEAYIDSLEREAEMFTDTVHAETPFETVFVGGGTPGLLSPKQLDRLFTNVIQKFNLSKTYELSIEFSPDTVTAEKLQVVKDHGFHRVSMGVQSFDEEILRLARRDETNPRKVIDQYYVLARSGIPVLNLDFIAGVERHDHTSMERTLDTVFALDRLPDQLTLFTLSVRRGTINARYINSSPEDVFQNSLAIYKYAQNRILDNGYWQFSRNLFPRGNNVFRYQDNIWGHNGYVLALGASGYSHSQKYVYQNFYDTKAYMQAVKENRLPIEKSYDLSDDEQVRRHIVLAMKHTSLDERKFDAFYGEGATELKRFDDELNALMDSSKIDRANGTVKYNRSGIAEADKFVRLFYSEEVNRRINDVDYGKKARDPFNFTI
jgi:oxygen-independent coproporphyrinogen III oxidase